MKRLRAHQRLIEQMHGDISDQLAEFQDRTEKILMDAIERSGLDISECRHCNKLVVCIPDGLSNVCEACAEKDAK